MDHSDVSTDLTTRPLRRGRSGVEPDDVALVTRLVLSCDVAVLGEPDSGAAEVTAMLGAPAMDLAASFLAYDGDEPVGWCSVESDRTGHQTFVHPFAPPGPRAREVRDLGLRRGIAAARTTRDAVAGPGRPWTVRAGCWLADEDYAATILAHGFVPVRRFFRMRIASSSPLVPAVAPTLPDGVELVVCDNDATRRRVWAVDEESFADHFNHTPREFDEWWAYVSDAATLDPAGWWLLTVDGDDAAICLLDDSRAELGDGYVAALGVRRPYRGRGLAQLLLRRAFVHNRDRGRAGTQLSVDSENATGAVAVYERVGMAVTRAFQGHAMVLD
ncbi:MAG TPA: GNAT family N-acetyltransferase [Candidatus Angelobacter sp.]|nr:GNAT family N-acetyltransferase [Candidatus Angelobacter sp.]